MLMEPVTPPSTRREADKTIDNLDYLAWVLADQKTVIILHASLRGSRHIDSRLVHSPSNLDSLKGCLCPASTSSPTFTFTATHQPPPLAGRGRGGRSTRAPNETGGRGRRRYPPHCQLCRTNGHFVNKCPQLPSFASQSPVNDDDLAKAFVAQCHVGSAAPDWTCLKPMGLFIAYLIHTHLLKMLEQNENTGILWKPAPTSSSYPMIPHAKAGIFKPRHLTDLSQLNHLPLHSALYATTDPTSFKTAERDPKWVKEMKQELDALHKNNTWSLVPRPTNRKIMGSKWFYRTKFHSDGSVERYKAHLVAQDGEPFSDLTQYRAIVRALQYLTITRPDISYAVNQVSQFLRASTNDHYQQIKRILRYIKGTLTYGLTFADRSQSALLGFSDAD
nr:putative ribonuclease H-like domain-containing protein [Tanacetum cinerariifolium]